MKALAAIALSLASFCASAGTVTLGNADGSEYPCGGLSRFCYGVPNDASLNVQMVYSYAGNAYPNSSFVELLINDVSYQSAPGMATFGPLIPVPNDPNCGITSVGRVYGCAYQAVGATFPDGSRLDMVMYTNTLVPRVCSGRGCGGARQRWYIQSGYLTLP